MSLLAEIDPTLRLFCITASLLEYKCSPDTILLELIFPPVCISPITEVTPPVNEPDPPASISKLAETEPTFKLSPIIASSTI